MSIIIAERALTSGLNPNLTLEKTTIGKVLAPGPVVKLATTRSSNESVNASNQPDNIAGNITGAVTFQKIIFGIVPRS